MKKTNKKEVVLKRHGFVLVIDKSNGGAGAKRVNDLSHAFGAGGHL